MVGQSHRVELTDRVVPLQDAAGILPGDGRTGLHLSPGDLRVHTGALAALGHEVVNPASSFFIARIPVLYRRVLDLGVVEGNELDHRGMELILVTDRRGTAFEIADIRALLRNDQGALELACFSRVNAEVGGQFHRTTHALGYIHKGPVTEHGGVERCKKVVGIRHYRAQILLYQLGVLLYRFGERAENHTGFSELLLERGSYRYAVEYRIHGDTGEQLLLREGDAELFVGAQDLGVELVQALQARLPLGG